MTDTASRAQLATPLHARTAELCVTNLWVEDGGFTVPALYSSLREEQEALVTRVGLSDLSARQCWLVEGADAAAYLSTVTVADVARLEPGQTVRTLWCDDDGHVRGEGVIARFGPNAFELSSAVRDFAWIADGRGGFDVKITNATGARAVIGVRGPRTAELLVAAGLSAEGASAGSVVRPSWRPAHVAMMRDAAGDGLELWMQSDDGAVVWDKLWRAGAVLGVTAIGATTLEAARVEAAVVRPGVDWQPAQLAHDPALMCIPSDLGVAIDPARRFNGALALRRAKGRGRVLVQLTSDQPLPLGPIAPKASATITSSAWSETRACAVALAWLDRDGARPGTAVQLQGGLGADVTREVFATRP